jgi:hypothetical protein
MSVSLTPNPNVVGPQGLQGLTGTQGTGGATGAQGTAGSTYLAPTLGSTALTSGSTVTTVNGLTKLVSDAFVELNASSQEQDLAIMNIMGGWN